MRWTTPAALNKEKEKRKSDEAIVIWAHIKETDEWLPFTFFGGRGNKDINGEYESYWAENVSSLNSYDSVRGPRYHGILRLLRPTIVDILGRLDSLTRYKGRKHNEGFLARFESYLPNRPKYLIMGRRDNILV